jgi:hypothetical protein
VKDRTLSGDATEAEMMFLKRLRFDGKRPTPLYYYRELQNLRDPLHFRSPMTPTSPKKTAGHAAAKGSVAPMHKYHEGENVEQQLQLDGRKKAIQRWADHKGNGGKNKK